MDYKRLKTWRSYQAEAASFTADEAAKLLPDEQLGINRSPPPLKNMNLDNNQNSSSSKHSQVGEPELVHRLNNVGYIDDILANPQISISDVDNSESECSSDNREFLDINIDDDAVGISLTQELRIWASNHRPTRAQTNDLLTILQKYHPELPKDARTLLKTQRMVPVEQKFGGQFSYFGIAECLKQNNMLNPDTLNIELKLNIDGLPLYRSSAHCFWPILVSANDRNPLVVSLFYGKSKPTDIAGFLANFVLDIKFSIQKALCVMGLSIAHT